MQHEFTVRVVEEAKTALVAHQAMCVSLLGMLEQLECVPGSAARGLARAIEAQLPARMRERGNRD